MNVQLNNNNYTYNKYMQENIKELVNEDVVLNPTQDIASLRHGGPIPVFVFDAMKDQSTWLREFGISMNTDITYSARTASTRRQFVPFQYKNKSNRERGQVIVPYVQDWTKKVDLPDTFDTYPRQLQGSLLHTSLHGLNRMDEYMDAGVLTHRIKTEIETPTGHTHWAFIYCHPNSSFMKYDPHDNKYSLSAGIRNTTVTGVPARRVWFHNTYSVGKVG